MHSSGDRSRNETGAEMDGQPGNEGIAETGEVGGCPSSQRPCCHMNTTNFTIQVKITEHV